MITLDQALALKHGDTLHQGDEHQCRARIIKWRVNGVCKTWKTRPGEFRLPLKRGLYEYWEVNDLNFRQFHLGDDCVVVNKYKQYELAI